MKPQCWRCPGSGLLKRTQKGREGESPESGLSAVNDRSSEVFYPLDPTLGVSMLEGKISILPR